MVGGATDRSGGLARTIGIRDGRPVDPPPKFVQRLAPGEDLAIRSGFQDLEGSPGAESVQARIRGRRLQVVQADLAAVGIQAQINTLEWAEWLQEQGEGNYETYICSWNGLVDPDDFYYAQHHSGGTSNAQKFSDPEVDQLLDAGRVETDVAGRKAIYARAATRIADEVSYIYLYNPSVIEGWAKNLSGYEARRDGAVRFRSASLNRGGTT